MCEIEILRLKTDLRSCAETGGARVKLIVALPKIEAEIAEVLARPALLP